MQSQILHNERTLSIGSIGLNGHKSNQILVDSSDKIYAKIILVCIAGRTQL